MHPSQHGYFEINVIVYLDTSFLRQGPKDPPDVLDEPALERERKGQK